MTGATTAAVPSTISASLKVWMSATAAIGANIDAGCRSVHNLCEGKQLRVGTMKVVITGGGGVLGKKLARRILQQGSIAGPDGKPREVRELLLFDVGKASGPGLDDPRVKTVAGDIANPSTVQSIVQGASTVFHFAAVV